MSSKLSKTAINQFPITCYQLPVINYELFFMQNKPNFQDNQVNVSNVLTTGYEDSRLSALAQNKPTSECSQTKSTPQKHTTSPRKNYLGSMPI